MRIKTSSRFEKNYKKLPAGIKQYAKRKEKVFRKDPFDPRLRTHKLAGKEQEIWSFRINYSYRIKFTFLRNQEVLFLDIGTHKIYKK